jgi:hypothetical protein
MCLLTKEESLLLVVLRSKQNFFMLLTNLLNVLLQCLYPLLQLLDLTVLLPPHLLNCLLHLSLQRDSDMLLP